MTPLALNTDGSNQGLCATASTTERVVTSSASDEAPMTANGWTTVYLSNLSPGCPMIASDVIDCGGKTLLVKNLSFIKTPVSKKLYKTDEAEAFLQQNTSLNEKLDYILLNLEKYFPSNEMILELMTDPYQPAEKECFLSIAVRDSDVLQEIDKFAKFQNEFWFPLIKQEQSLKCLGIRLS